MTKTLTSEQIVRIVEEEFDEPVAVFEKINRWLIRGDGVAIYENALLGHPGAGDLRLVSYGSERAQLEVDIPPDRLPDIGNQINWRFQLKGAYRGETL
jgi:hypothetical protein